MYDLQRCSVSGIYGKFRLLIPYKRELNKYARAITSRRVLKLSKNKAPQTIYSHIPVKRKKKYNIIPLIIIVIVVLGGAYSGYSFYLSRQYNALTANLFYSGQPLEIKGTDQKLEKGGSAKEGETIQTPFDEDRAVFFIGKDITLRLASMSRLKFLILKRKPRAEEQIIELQLEKGDIWITAEKAGDTVIVRYPVADVRIKEKSKVELRTTEAGSLEVLCWDGFAEIIPSIEKDKPIEMGALQRTIIKKSGTMAAPYDIVQKDMNVWEAWNLETDTGEIISGMIPSFVEAFKAQRKKLKITGGYSGKVVLTPRTLLSGKLEYQYWHEVGISGDSSLIISSREDKLFKSEAGNFNLLLSFRNDGKKDAVGLDAVVEVIDKTGRVVGRMEKKIPALPPLEAKEVAFKIDGVPTAINYRVRILFPE